MKKCFSRLLASILLVCMMVPAMASLVYATDISDLERLAQTERIVSHGTYQYGDITLTFASGEPIYENSDDHAPSRDAVSNPFYIFDANGDLVLSRIMGFTINGSSGNYSFSTPDEWSWTTIEVGEGVLLSGVKNTQVSATIAEHAFTRFVNDKEFRTVVTFVLNPNTMSVTLFPIQNTPMN